MNRRRPRVAHVINSIGLGGVPEAVYHLLQHLPGARFDRHIVVLRPFVSNDSARAERFLKLKSLGLPISFVPEGEHKLATVAGLLDIFAEGHFDIVHAHSYRPNLFARMAALLLKPGGPQIIGHYHNQYDANWQRDGTRALDCRLAMQSDRVIACSNAVRDHIAERLNLDPAATVVIPNGVDVERFETKMDRVQARGSLGLPAEGPIITLVGRISAQKGQRDLVTAAPAILARFPSATFVFAGLPDENGTQEQLHADIAGSGHAGSFHFAGYVDRMPELYAASDVLAAPSRWEGFGLMLVEAMAAGVPIVATRVGGIPEVTGEDDAAILVDPGVSAALAAALIDILSHDELASALKAKGRRRAQIFSWRRSAEQLSALYDEMLGA